MSMVVSIGPSAWFLTLSANDLGWDYLGALLLKTTTCTTYQKRKYQTLPINLRNQLVNEQPVVCARHFMYRLRSFLRLILLNPTVCPLGTVTDYFIRIEFQLRGSPHAHMLLQVDSPPDYSTPDGIDYIDSIVSCSLSIPEEESQLVRKLQMHRHTKTCFKRGSKQCRFQFPRPVASVTRILTDDEAQKSKRTVIYPGEECVNN